MPSDTYAAVHLRLTRQRGPASTHTCVDCGKPARDWSWNRTGPSMSGPRYGKQVTWGTDLADYSPRCRRHNTILDAGGTLTEYPCGHPRTADNTHARSTGKTSCATCENAQVRRRRARMSDRE